MGKERNKSGNAFTRWGGKLEKTTTTVGKMIESKKRGVQGKEGREKEGSDESRRST